MAWPPASQQATLQGVQAAASTLKEFSSLTNCLPWSGHLQLGTHREQGLVGKVQIRLPRNQRCLLRPPARCPTAVVQAAATSLPAPSHAMTPRQALDSNMKAMCTAAWRDLREQVRAGPLTEAMRRRAGSDLDMLQQ